MTLPYHEWAAMGSCSSTCARRTGQVDCHAQITSNLKGTVKMTTATLLKPSRPRLAFPPRRKRAVSIFGVILGVAVSGIVIAGLVAAYNGVVTSVRAGNVQSAVLAAVGNVRSVMANATTFQDTGIVDSMHALIYSSAPSNMQNTAGSAPDEGIVFPWWEGDSTLEGAAYSTTNYTEDEFSFLMQNIPSAVCEAVGGVFVEDPSVVTMMTAAAGTTPTATGAATEITLAARCAAGINTDDQVDIIIRFRG